MYSKQPSTLLHKNESVKNTIGTAFLPFVHGVTDQIGKILYKQELRTVFKESSKILEILPSRKDKYDTFLCKGIYKILCFCGKIQNRTDCKSFVFLNIKDAKNRAYERSFHNRNLI